MKRNHSRSSPTFRRGDTVQIKGDDTLTYWVVLRVTPGKAVIQNGRGAGRVITVSLSTLMLVIGSRRF